MVLHEIVCKSLMVGTKFILAPLTGGSSFVSQRCAQIATVA